MPPRAETPDKATFVTDDKRAQYARLVAFNHGVKAKVIEKGKYDVNSVTPALLEKSARDLVGGNLLDGKDGIAVLISLTKAGATDEKVAERGLTLAYAQEVRPFLRRLQFSDSFGRRGNVGKTPEEKAAEAEVKEKAKAEKVAAREAKAAEAAAAKEAKAKEREEAKAKKAEEAAAKKQAAAEAKLEAAKAKLEEQAEASGDE